MSTLTETEKWRWHAYAYGTLRWGQTRGGEFNDYPTTSAIDPTGKWFHEEMAIQAEQMFHQERCQAPSCGSRWRQTGFICCVGCRKYVPEYRKLSEEQAYQKLGERSVSTRGKWLPDGLPTKTPWRYRVAAAYRWAFANGHPMPPGLDENSQVVRDLVDAYENNSVYAEQDREREAAKARIIGDGKNPDGTPTPEASAFVELCSRQIAANMKTFHARNAQAFAEPQASAPTPQPAPPPKREPNYPDKRSIEELLATLGVKATEQEPPP